MKIVKDIRSIKANAIEKMWRNFGGRQNDRDDMKDPRVNVAKHIHNIEVNRSRRKVLV